MPGPALTKGRRTLASSSGIASLCGALLGLAGCADDTGFDFYVLALSWSPAYCAAEGADASPAQCAGDGEHRFIVHGLWPQYEQGWPEYCQSNEPDFVPASIVADNFDIMPSGGLIGHQWRKHGSCTGLSHADYFSTLRRAWERIEIPAPFKEIRTDMDIAPEEAADAFVAANPGLDRNGMTVTCDARRLREIRICLTRELEFRSCEEVAARSCDLPSAELVAP